MPVITALVRSSNLVTQVEGGEVTLKCPVQPPVGSERYDWVWKRLNEHGVLVLARIYIVHSKVAFINKAVSLDIRVNSLGNELTIRGLEKDDGGVYECKWKESGISSKGNFSLTVRGKLRQSMKTHQSLYIYSNRQHTHTHAHKHTVNTLLMTVIYQIYEPMTAIYDK